MNNNSQKFDAALWDVEFPVKKNNSKLSPLLTGTVLPGFSLPANMCIWQKVSNGRHTGINKNAPTIQSIIAGKPLTISFLSGGWNKYGLQHLQVLKQVYQEILALGGNLLVIVNASYADTLDMVQYFEVPFNVVADPQNEIAENFGIYSKDIPVWDRVTGLEEHVPVPATYVVNQVGNVIYHAIDENFNQPFSPTEMLGAVLAASHRVPYAAKYRYAA